MNHIPSYSGYGGRNTNFLLNTETGVVLMVMEKTQHLYIVAGPNDSGNRTNGTNRDGSSYLAKMVTRKTAG